MTCEWGELDHFEVGVIIFGCLVIVAFWLVLLLVSRPITIDEDGHVKPLKEDL